MMVYGAAFLLFRKISYETKTKHIVGHVEYMEDNHQFIRITSDGRVDGFRNPFDQVKRHVRFLRRLFQMSGQVDVDIF